MQAARLPKGQHAEAVAATNAMVVGSQGALDSKLDLSLFHGFAA
jgi:hypothetical protein